MDSNPRQLVGRRFIPTRRAPTSLAFSLGRVPVSLPALTHAHQSQNFVGRMRIFAVMVDRLVRTTLSPPIA